MTTTFTVYHGFGGIMHKENDNDWFVDQLEEHLTYVHKSRIARHIKQKYNLTPKQYYGIVAHNDINYVKLCERPGCNNVAIFGIGWGYGQCCCNSCHVSIATKRKWTESDYRAKHSTALINNNLTGKAPAGLLRTTFLCQGNLNDLCTVYIGFAGIKDTIKLGVTAKTIEERLRRNKLFTIHAVYRGTRLECAEIERQWKVKLQSSTEWIDVSRIKEIFSALRFAIAKAKSIIESSSTIETADISRIKE